MEEKIKSMTNNDGINFMFRFDDYEVLGIEDRGEKNWFYTVVRYHGSQKVCVLSMPRKESGCKPSHFGHLEYYALLASIEFAGIKVVWARQGWPMWPVWYCDDEQKLSTFRNKYREIIGKYGFDERTIERNRYSN